MSSFHGLAGRVARFSTPTALAFVLAVAGCGSDDGVGKRYPVTGNVTYKGQPVAKGTINFVPDTEAGRGATGSIVNGKYSLSTQNPDDGALPGGYKVTVSTTESDLSKVEDEAKKAAGGASNAMPDQVAISKAPSKSSTPAKYAAFLTTDLKAEVKAQSNTIDFDLKD